MHKDVTILYQGGSGGFALFYFLLLSGRYNTGLEYTNIQHLIDTQFPTVLKDQPTLWKNIEHWPDNQLCKNRPGPRLFLICNPLWSSNIIKNISISKNTHSILLYTNFKLQLRMCWEKQAYWFTETSRQYFKAPQNNKQYIRQILKMQKNALDPDIDKIKIAFNPTQTVELTKFINDKNIPGFDEPNQDQIDFLNRWANLQPYKVRNVLLR